MTHFNTLDVKLSSSQRKKLKSAIKTKVTLNRPSNIVRESNDENSCPHKLLLNIRQVSKLCKAFANNCSANIKLSKPQLHIIIQSGGFLSRLLGHY